MCVCVCVCVCMCVCVYVCVCIVLYCKEVDSVVKLPFKATLFTGFPSADYSSGQILLLKTSYAK